MNDENQYHYTYSPKEQAEIKKIRDKYTKKEESGLEQLRRMDMRVTKKAGALAMTLGIAGCLILGLGMSCIMAWGGRLYAAGVLIGLVGMAGVGVAYPLYTRIIKKEREKIAPEILRLSGEILKS